MAPTSHPLVSYQPIKLVFQVTYVATIILRLPYYVVISMFPFLRANKNWSMKQNLMTRLVHPLLDSTSRVGISDPLTLNPGKEGNRWQIVPAGAPKYFKGPLVEFDDVRPAKIGATWYPERPPIDLSGKKVVFYLHGGAFVQGDGRPALYAPVANYFLEKKTGDYVFALQYRLSGHGGLNPYPAALQDAVSGYIFLLNDLKVPAKNIILAGDSAGGNLGSALLRYIVEFGNEVNLPNPECAILLSPWNDPAYSDPTGNPQLATDFVTPTYGKWGCSTYSAKFEDPRSNPYITALGHPYATPVPLFINAGTAELFYSRIVEWSKEMAGVKGNKVQLNEEKDAPHDTIYVGGIMGFEESAWSVAEAFSKWYKAL